MATSNAVDDLRRSVDALLCENVRDWLRQRGWEGEAEWLDDPGSREPSSWTFEIGSGERGPSCLQFHFPRGAVCDPADRALLLDYLRATSRMQNAVDGAASATPEWTLVSRSDITQRLHQLNNRLNSLLINVGVLATAHQEGDRLARFAEQANRDGIGCAEAISRLSASLLESGT